MWKYLVFFMMVLEFGSCEEQPAKLAKRPRQRLDTIHEIFEFMKLALKGKAATPFRAPAGLELIPIDPKTGQRAAYGDENVILEAFKPGEQPPEEGYVIGENLGPSSGDNAVIEGGLTTGTGGLY